MTVDFIGWFVADFIFCKILKNFGQQLRSMLGRNWCTSVTAYVYPYLHERLLLIIWNCTCDPRFVYPQYTISCCWSMSNVSFRVKQDKAELWKQKVTVTCVAVATTKLLLGLCNCTVDRNIGTGDLKLVLGILQVCGYVHVWSHVPPGMDCN